MEAEDLGAAPRVPEPPAGEPGETRGPERPVEQPQVGEVGAGVGVGPLRAEPGRLEPRRHERELLAPQLRRVERPQRRRAAVHPGPVGLDRRGQLRDRLLRSPLDRRREPTPERRGVGREPPDREGPLAIQRRARHLGRDEGVAVPVAADPGAEPEERAHAEVRPRPGRRERVLQLPVDLRHDVEQRPLEDLRALRAPRRAATAGTSATCGCRPGPSPPLAAPRARGPARARRSADRRAGRAPPRRRPRGRSPSACAPRSGGR